MKKFYSFVVNFLEAGGNMRDVAFLIGHRSERTTRKFYDSVRLERLGKVLDNGKNRAKPKDGSR